MRDSEVDPGPFLPQDRCPSLRDLTIIHYIHNFDSSISMLTLLDLPTLASIHLHFVGTVRGSLSARHSSPLTTVPSLKKLLLTFDDLCHNASLTLREILSPFHDLIELELNVPNSKSVPSTILDVFEPLTRSPGVGSHIRRLSLAIHPHGTGITQYLVAKCVGFLETMHARSSSEGAVMRLSDFSLVGRFPSISHPFAYDSVMLDRLANLESRGAKCVIRELD